MENIQEAIATIKARNCELSVTDGKIVSSRPLLRDEKRMLKENREEAIAIIIASMPETPEQAYARGQQDGYAAGVRHTLEQAKSEPAAAPVPVAPAPTTPEREIERFVKWQHERGEYYHWEPECMEALREALGEGDRVQPIFAYSCIIMRGDGNQVEFKRVPNKKK